MRYYLVMHSMHTPVIRFGKRADILESETKYARGVPPTRVVAIKRDRVAETQRSIRLGMWGKALLAEAGVA